MLAVLLDEDFDATAIYEATRADVIAALTTPGSKARTERGASAFRSSARSAGSGGREMTSTILDCSSLDTALKILGRSTRNVRR